jgi:hypothetical protein
MEAIVAAAPEHVDDPDCPYDTDDPDAFEAYWANAKLIMPGEHLFQKNLKRKMSEKNIAEKMFVKNATSIAVLNAGPGNADLVAALPAGRVAAADEPADFVLMFANNRRELDTFLPQAKALLLPKGALWVAYVKGTSKHASDVQRDTIRTYAETIGLTSVSLVAVDEHWSALRLKLS